MSRLFFREVITRSRAFISVAILLGLTLIAPVAVVSAPLTSVFVNGVRVEAYPVIHDGVAYLPIQVMAQAMESEIIWDAKLGIVKVNGVNSPASVYNSNGKILLPIESFVTGLGGGVVYDGRNNMIRVETPEYMASSLSRTKNPATNTAPATTAKAAAVGTGKVAGTAIATAPAVGGAVTGTALASTNRPSGTTTTVVTPARTAPAQATTPSYGTYNRQANAGYNAATSSQTAYGTAHGTVPAMAPRTATTVKPAYQPPYTNTSMNHTMSMNTPGAFPAGGAVTGGTAPNVGISSIPSLSQAGATPYIPRTAQNSVFKVTVSNLEVVPVIKDFYKPRTGSKFVVASLSQQNISNQVQIYTGKFSLVDQNQNSYDHLEGLSNFWLVILRPFGVNFGYLVFEIPQNSKPISLVLHALNQAPLTINL